MGTVKPEWVPPLNACLHKCQNPCRLQRDARVVGAARTMLPLTSNLAPISECSRGLTQNSTLPFGLVTNWSSNSVYPLSLAARKNACKVEWWLSVNRDDLLLISTLQPEIRKCLKFVAPVLAFRQPHKFSPDCHQSGRSISVPLRW